jgi:hypothetical protein
MSKRLHRSLPSCACKPQAACHLQVLDLARCARSGCFTVSSSKGRPCIIAYAADLMASVLEINPLFVLHLGLYVMQSCTGQRLLVNVIPDCFPRLQVFASQAFRRSSPLEGVPKGSKSITYAFRAGLVQVEGGRTTEVNFFTPDLYTASCSTLQLDSGAAEPGCKRQKCTLACTV